jgi:predicted transcriptional regulator of viral defense system
MPGRAYDALFALAADQFGYVTREQSLAAGFADKTLRQMARRGVVEHIDHGLYRFKAFPAGPLDAYMEAALWPHRKSGVLSHETALELYGLSDANPDKIHLTVPKKHRITRKIPTVYEIHHADLSPDEVTWREGLPLTTVERTIRDCYETHLRRGLLEQALEQARARGLISAAKARQLRKEMDSPVVPAAQAAE